MTIHGVVEKVGTYISNNPSEFIPNTEKAKELIVQVDGGHLKSKDKTTRSFEVLTSVVYKPENIKKSDSNKRGRILQKHSSASSLNDNQEQIKKLTLLSSKKEGLTPNAKIVAICDGATNCWKVIDCLKSYCKSITYILDWFHISIRFQNIGILTSNHLNELLKSSKWSLCNGKPQLFYKKIEKIITEVTNKKLLKKLKSLCQYIKNNEEKIINYSLRKANNQVFTSNLAESTVESLINQRCKGKQHMQWSRRGAAYFTN